MKTGIVDVGGGIRGAYAAGVLDHCLENNISFDAGVGVSAGSANLASFMAGQKGRNYRFYTDYVSRKEYMGLKHFFSTGNYLDLDYIYTTLSVHDGEDPLDYRAIAANPMEYYVVSCNAVTGKTKYFTKADLEQDRYDILKASSCIPAICKPYPFRGELYFDGALADPVPLEKAFSLGCGKVILILTKPKDLIRRSGKDNWAAMLIEKKYPLASGSLRQRAEKYNAALRKAKEDHRVLILAPEDTFGVDTLTKDKEKIDRLYRQGKEDAKAIPEFLDRTAIESVGKNTKVW